MSTQKLTNLKIQLENIQRKIEQLRIHEEMLVKQIELLTKTEKN
jgi:hypothetical protein